MRYARLPIIVSLFSLVMFSLPSGGCSGDLKNGGRGWGSLFGPKGEPWTIQCLVLTGENRRAAADNVADVLRDTPKIDRRKIRLEHGEEVSTVYYGQYVRRIDSQTRRPEVTAEMNRDMLLIKQLGVPGRGHFFAEARFVPMPTPDVGNPAWALERFQAVYTLRVALFANKPDFYERKKAAAEYTAMLRKKGYRAFYYHGSIHSEVFVGEFGEDAVRSLTGRALPTDNRGGYAVVAYDLLSPEVRALQAKENFAFELWNLRKRGEQLGNKTVYTASKLVRVRNLLNGDEW